MSVLILFPTSLKVFCPICNKTFDRSEYLKSVISNKNTEWLANMITHYRHNHITSWNKCWDYNGNAYRRKWFKGYDEEKSLVNERAKRQIVRKAKTFIKQVNITIEDFRSLSGNSQDTIKLVDKLLSN